MNKISVLALVMLMTGAVDGVSNLPSIAIFGSNLIFFFIVAAILFLIPTGLVSAELCKQSAGQAGIYVWTKQAFGKHVGIIAIWLQWINTMVWFPTCLTTLTATFAYLIDPQLINKPIYLVAMSVSTFWIMTLLNLKGIHHSSKIATLATTLGMIIPMSLIIMLSITWLLIGKPLALHIHSSSLIPSLSHSNSWTSLTAIITAFLGMELATVHVNKVNNAKSVFPKALIYSIILIMLTMGFGSLGIALVVPHADIVLASGTIQAFNSLFNGFHLTWLEPILGCMLIFGSLGTMINWLISPANGLLQAAQDGFLPPFLAKENKHQTPGNMLILQAIVVTLISSAFFLMPSVNGSYWLLLDLSTELYVLMYILMFVVAFVLIANAKIIQLIPGKKIGAYLLIIAGLLGCSSAFIVGFFPPSNINVGSPTHYLILFGGGLAVMISPLILLYGYQYQQKKKHRTIAIQASAI